MKADAFRTVAGIAVFLILFPCRVSAEAEIALKADTSKKCAICHYQWVSTFYLEHRGTPIARIGEASQEMFSREVCISCHDGSIRDSRRSICEDPGHRVGRVPSARVSIPPEFPLDEKGSLKCTTCHTPHAVSEHSASMVDYFLRAPNENSSFCRVCHRSKLGGTAGGNHPLDVTVTADTRAITGAGGKFGTSGSPQVICETCHRAHGGVNSKRLVLPVEDVKSLSVLCEVCHTARPGSPGGALPPKSSHPVDRAPTGDVRIPSAWPNGERVVVGSAGEIVCRTCHRPHDAAGEFLLASPAGTKDLCTQCHPAPAMTAAPLSGENLPAEPAAARFPCESCHRAHDERAAFQNVLNGLPNMEPLLRIPHGSLHPRVFFGSAFSAPGDFGPGGIALFDDGGNRAAQGTVVCATCHDAAPAGLHDSSLLAEEDQRMPAGFLRTGIAETFCKVCHGEEALVRFLYFHEKW